MLVSKDVHPPVLKAGAPECCERCGCGELCGDWGRPAGVFWAGGGAETDAQPPRLLAGGSTSPTVAQPDVLGGSTGAVATAAQPLFLGPLEPAASDDGPEGATAVTTGLTILTPAAFAILRSSFSSRLRSFSLRLLTSSSVLRLARWAACMSRKRTL